MILIIRPRAKQDILLAAQYIADFNPAAAKQWRQSIHGTCRALSDMPGMGHHVSVLPDDIRMFSKGSYLIFFVVDEDKVEIIRVLHAARDWTKLIT
jgi:toxin ParE1/3/4